MIYNYQKHKEIQKEMRIDCRNTAKQIVNFLRDYFQRSGHTKAVVGLSGGVDSSVITALCVNALGPKNVVVALLPYEGVTSSRSKLDAYQIIKRFDLSNNVRVIGIKEAVDVFAKQEPDRTGLANIMARARMIYLYNLARGHRGLVMGTCNKSEILLGYSTRWGDGASDILPIGNLYKIQVCQLARYLGIPERIIKKKPTAELWKDQTDEKDIGYSYDFLDPMLYLMSDKKIPTKALASYYGYRREDVEEIKNQVKVNKFKRKLSPVFKITFSKKK